MKRILWSAFLLVAALAPAGAQVSPIRLRVEQVSKSDTIAYKSVQSRSLKIAVSNSGAAPAELKLKYVIFGRDIATKAVVAVARGELPVSVPARGTEKVETPVAQAASEEERIGSKGKSPAIGQRIIGQGVLALQGEAVVAEYFEPASLKPDFDKAPLAEPLDKKKKKKD